MKCTPDKNDPFSFEGPEIYKCKVNYFLFYLIYFLVRLQYQEKNFL